MSEPVAATPRRAARFADFASLVKLSHSVFALPFALLSLLAATAGRPGFGTLFWVVVAVVAARTAAMAYNRFADRDLDAANPRTQNREIPRGAVSPRAALGLVVMAGSVFVLACANLSPWCLWLSLPTLAWLCAYSHVKRFSSWCHLWLGTALGLAPIAAWLAADGEFGPRLWAPLVLGIGVATWVAGFDVLYACQDEAFDRRHGLHSVPVRFGLGGALHIARALHVLAFAGFVGFGLLVPLGVGYAIGLAAALLLLVLQHWLLRRRDLTHIEMAFFTANGALSLFVFAAGCADLYWFGVQS